MGKNPVRATFSPVPTLNPRQRAANPLTTRTTGAENRLRGALLWGLEREIFKGQELPPFRVLRSTTMTVFQLPIALPRVTHDGEILNSCTRIGREIGSGRHGSAHEGILNGEKVCFKSYHFSWSHAFTSNSARHEYGRLLQARKDLPEITDFIQSPIGWYQDPLKGHVLVTRLIQDHNGAPSMPLKYTPEISPSFLNQLESVFESFAAKQVLYNPVAANILVQRTSTTESRPVLIDFTNYESYLHYIGKGAAHFISPASRARDISAWLQATLRIAKEKTIERSSCSLSDYTLPPHP